MRAQLPFRRSLIASMVCVAGTTGAMAQETANNELEEVLVTSQRQPYRGDTPLESLPQQVQILGDELLVEVGAVSFQDALDYAGGFARQNSFGGLWDSFAIRGFAGDENLPSGYLINGFSGGRGFSGNRDASNIETIEILKGPGSALYGRGEPGGTVNIITKKPQFDTEGYVRGSAGRWSTYRVEGDYTTGLTDKLAVRINGAYEDTESFRDTVETERLVLTPSVLYLLGDRSTINYEMEYLDQEAPFDRGIAAINGDPEALPVSRFLGEPDNGPNEIKAIGHQITFQHELNNDWSLLGGIGYRESSLEGINSGAELSGGRQLLDDDGETLVRQPRNLDYDAEDLSGRIELSGSFDTGPFKHHFMVGADAYEYELDSFQERFRVAFGTGDTTYSINVFNPEYGQTVPPLTTFTDRLEEQSARGLYMQDQIDLSEKWKVLFGVRYDDYDQDVTNRLSGSKVSQSLTQTSPRAGIVFEPNDNLSIYASYAEGFRPNSGIDANDNAFDPEETKSYEAGVKYYNETISATVAVFSMEKSNILTADPVNQGFSAALGEAESEGVEIDITGQLTDSLSLMLNYAYVDAKTTNTVVNADWGVEIPAGSPLINIPENSANMVLKQDFTFGGSPASMGLSVIYVDDRLGETIDPSYILPSYTLLNLFGSYQMTDRLKLSVNLDNVTDEEYYVSSYHKWWTMPGAPFSWTVGAEYAF